MKSRKAQGKTISTVWVGDCSASTPHRCVDSSVSVPPSHSYANYEITVVPSDPEDGVRRRTFLVLENYGDDRGAHTVLPRLCAAMCGRKKPWHVQLAVCLATGRLYFASYLRADGDNEVSLCLLLPARWEERKNEGLRVSRRVIKALRNNHYDHKRPYVIHFTELTIVEILRRDIGWEEAATRMVVTINHSGTSEDFVAGVRVAC